jgi:hypothetical protein
MISERAEKQKKELLIAEEGLSSPFGTAQIGDRNDDPIGGQYYLAGLVQLQQANRD